MGKHHSASRAGSAMIPREREINICSSGVGGLIILNGVLFVSPIKV